jgi:UDP-N-acetylglucosamine--N-acetylmuramyl-(pentapeptide) pyrophosphoryl-undecaprenol N-acetylglucosamine transferase
MSAQAPLVLMMAGGTGGHVYPALAVASELGSRGYRVQWLGTHRGLESRVVPAAGIKLHYLPVRGVRGKNPLHKLLSLVYLALAAVKALWLVLRLAPGCVVGMGGYVAGPGGVAAWLCRRPLLIHEQNAVAGTTNRLLAPLAKKIMAGFPGAFPNREHIVSGNPVRRDLVDSAAASPYTFSGGRPMRLLVLGGSLGAQPINNILPPVVRSLLGEQGSQAVEVWHQTGEAHATGVRDEYSELAQGPVRVMPFIEDMAAAYSWADLVLCRAGALTVAELAIMGRPAILVPLPHAIDDHQSANARTLSEAGAAILMPQGEMSEASLATCLNELLSQPQDLARMAEAAAGAALPEATAVVSSCCEDLIHGR